MERLKLGSRSADDNLFEELTSGYTSLLGQLSQSNDQDLTFDPSNTGKPFVIEDDDSDNVSNSSSRSIGESSSLDGNESIEESKGLIPVPERVEHLRKLHRSDVRTGRNRGTSPTNSLVQTQRSMVTELDLSRAIMDEEEATRWANIIAGSRTLEVIDISHISVICDSSWVEMFLSLQKSRCTLKKLSLRGNTITDEAALSLSKVLIYNRTLKVLDLSLLNYHRHLSTASWRAIFECLKFPKCKLQDFKLARAIANDDVMISLARSLAINSVLRDLDLSDNEGVTAMGWNAFFSILENQASSLESLDLSFNSICDDAVSTLVGSLAENSKLRELDLNCNHGITAAGCEYFSAVLQNPISMLERLHLRYNFMNNGTMISLAGALSNNNRLKELLIYDEDLLDDAASTASTTSSISVTNSTSTAGTSSTSSSTSTREGWTAFSRILCDESSIMATHTSNHTLEQLVCEEFIEDDLPEDIKLLLRTNRKYSKRQAARLKVITTHFVGKNIDIQPFIDMDAKVLPHAVAWVLENECGDNTQEGAWGIGFDLAYEVLSRVVVPAFF